MRHTLKDNILSFYKQLSVANGPSSRGGISSSPPLSMLIVGLDLVQHTMSPIPQIQSSQLFLCPNLIYFIFPLFQQVFLTYYYQPPSIPNVTMKFLNRHDQSFPHRCLCSEVFLLLSHSLDFHLYVYNYVCMCVSLFLSVFIFVCISLYVDRSTVIYK